jgi:hypothetical protein
VTSTATKHANKSFLSSLGDFFPHFSLWVEGWLWAGWVVSFGGFDYFLLLVIVGARDELRSTLHTLVRAPLNSLTTEAKLIQVTSMVTKYANKSFLSSLGDFFPHFSLWVEGWLWAGWVVSFGGFDYFLILVIVGARDELRSTLHTLVHAPLKTNTQPVCGLGCTLINMTQIILNRFLTHNRPLKMRSHVSNLLL